MKVGDGTPGPGRPKGSTNKATREVRQAFHDAFFERGGVKALLTWAKDNESEFYKLAARLIPVEVQGSIAHTHTASELSDDELARIAAGSSARTAVPTQGPSRLN